VTGRNLLFIAQVITVFNESCSFPFVRRSKILVDLWKGAASLHVQVAVFFVEIHVATLGCGLLFPAAFGQMIYKSLLVVQEKFLAVHATEQDDALVHVVSPMPTSKLT